MAKKKKTRICMTRAERAQKIKEAERLMGAKVKPLDVADCALVLGVNAAWIYFNVGPARAFNPPKRQLRPAA